MSPKTTGPVSAKLIQTLYEQNKVIFTLRDVVEITNLSKNAASDFTSELIKRAVIARIKSGKYIIVPQEINENVEYLGNWYVAGREIVKAPRNYYISHYSALDIHNMLTHPITKVFITTPKQEYPKQKSIANTIFEFIYTNIANIWGVENVWVTNSEQVRVSNIERTILDCLYQPKYCGGILVVAQGIWYKKEKIDFNKLLEYAIRFNRNVIFKRLGYLLESLSLTNQAYLKKLRARINNKYYVLDPLLSIKKTFKNSWKCIANISPEELNNSIRN